MAWEAVEVMVQEEEKEESNVADGRKGADGERLISGGRSDGCPV